MTESTSPWIKDVTDSSFEADVIEASRSRPVVVDYWNESCQPCLMLKPILEQAALDRDGDFLLAKCNTNEAPRHAMEFGVQGIPAVFGVLDGEVVDFFSGFMPAEAVNQWLDRLTIHQALKEAAALEESDPEAAETIYRKLLDSQEDFALARIGLARALLAMDEEEACEVEIQKLQNRGYLEPEGEQVVSALKLRSQKDVNLDSVQAAADADPDNLEAQIAFGEALAGQGQHEKALETLVAVIERQKDGPGEDARLKMLDIFRVLGDENDVTREYRRRLSAALF